MGKKRILKWEYPRRKRTMPANTIGNDTLIEKFSEAKLPHKKIEIPINITKIPDVRGQTG